MERSAPDPESFGPQPGFPDRRDRLGDRWTRLGMITPSSNTVLEPETGWLLAPLGDAVSVHFARLPVTQISLGAASLAQFGEDAMLAAARSLADARPSVIAWNGTSAGWLGLDGDRRLAARIAAETGVPATSTMLCYEALFSALAVRKLGLVTPYTSEIQDRITANLVAGGLEVIVERHLEDAGNFSFAEYSGAFVADQIREAAAAGPDAVAVVCTNYRGARAAAAVEAETGVLVLDSVAVTAWGALAAAGLDPKRLAERGRLFADAPIDAANAALRTSH